MAIRRYLLGAVIIGGILLVSQGKSHATEDVASTIYSVLPKDAIAAILHPTFVPAEQAQVAPDTAMIGVVFGGEAHAYAAVLLNAHEIVNDVVGGENIATTW